MTTSNTPPTSTGVPVPDKPKKKISTHWLYIAVIVAVVAGVAVGLIFG
jgi:aerobic C4-dicarboxylate transport protein